MHQSLFFSFSKRAVPVAGKLSLLLLLVICSAFYNSAWGQNVKVTGKIVDKNTQEPMVGVNVFLNQAKDSTKQVVAVTDNGGNFVFFGLKSQPYLLKTLYLGYAELRMPVDAKYRTMNLGVLTIEEKAKEITEVVVVREAPPAVQKGDTTEMNSSAYKTNPDANAEDLVKKMPGITVENGAVKAHGEDVKRILIDGKQFFGDDPAVALKNLPADVIEKVQVFNKLSDQAELTGFDDGNSAKTLNIVTKQNRRVGKFGKFTGGTDFQDKNLLAGSLNLFKGQRRITLIGLDNDVNQQNFSMQDLIGSTGGGGGGRGGRGGGGGSFGSSPGITTTKSIGGNYTDTWGKKININASYFYNTSKNVLNQVSNTENFVSLYKQTKDSSNSVSKNYNHRFNLRLEYAIDSLNSLIVTPRLSFQENNSANLSNVLKNGEGISTSSQNNNTNNASAYNFSNDLVFRHKFMKPGRTFSVGLSTSANNRKSTALELASIDNKPDNQRTDGLTDGYALSSNLSYTEPLGKRNLLQVNYNLSYSENETDRITSQMDDNYLPTVELDSLSNVYNNNYLTNRGGLAYLIRNENGSLNASIGGDYQKADLSGNQTKPLPPRAVDKSFENFLPNFMLNYKFSNTSSIRVFYRTSTNAPSISQLQNVVNNSNRLSLSTGNPDLKQEYSHNLTTRYSYANPTKGTNFFGFVSGSYTADNIANKTIYSRKGTIFLPQYNVSLTPGMQISAPVNMDYAWSMRSFFSFGVLIKPIKCNINFLNGFNYSQSPGYIDTLLNRSNSYTITNGLVVSSNISEKIDFSLSYTSNYSIVENSVTAPGITNTKYWYQSTSAKVNWIFWKGFLLQSDLVGQFNKGLSGDYNQNYVVWNGSFGKKILKNNAGEIKLSVFDILNQNKNVSRSVTANYISDTRTNTFPRYFLIIFTYNLRSFNGMKPPSERTEEHDHGPGRRPGGYRGGGGPGGGPMF